MSLIKNKIIMKPFNLEEYLANPTKKVITRDGHDVRIVCTDCKNYEYPTVALVTCDDDEFVVNCTKEGKCHTSNKYEYDLFFAPDKKSGWINLYKMNSIINPGPRAYDTKEEAESAAGDKSYYVATIKIEWEE